MDMRNSAYEINKDPDRVIEQAIARHAQRPGAMLPLLQEIQDGLGYLPQHSLARVAVALHRSVAEVYGVVRFYHDFRLSPPGRHVLRICLAEACRSMGAGRLLEHARATLGVDLHQTTGDGALSFEPVYCLGNCACAPALMIDGEVVGRVDAQRLGAIVARCREPA